MNCRGTSTTFSTTWTSWASSNRSTFIFLTWGASTIRSTYSMDGRITSLLRPGHLHGPSELHEFLHSDGHLHALLDDLTV